nr:RNA ligase family protein [Mycolicibacterium fortuitum]
MASARDRAARRRTTPAPMLATLGPPPDGDGYAVEWKFDGQRAAVVVEGSEVTVFSRSGANVTRAFPELQDVAAAVGFRSMVLDGEIIAPDVGGVPSFARLQQRWPQNRRPTPELLRQVPVQLAAFDVVAIDGREITTTIYERRRAVLDTVAAADAPGTLVVPRSWTGVSPADMLDIAGTAGMEGIVVKKLDSLYLPGRSKLWVKCPVRPTVELVIVGYWPAAGPGGSLSIGALLLAGHNEAGELVPVAKVGTGFSAASRRRLYQLLHPIEDSTTAEGDPAALQGVRRVRPVYVGEVAYHPGSGRWLRHTAWKGLRSRPVSAVQLPV